MNKTNSTQTKRLNKEECSNVDDLHLFLVIHVVNGQTSLVDEKVQRRILLNQQLVCQQHNIRLAS